MQKNLRRNLWKEHTNLRKEKDKKFMAFVKGWRHKAEEKLFKEEEIEAENTFLLKADLWTIDLKKNSQFSYIYKRGERVNTQYFTLFVVKSRFDDYKIGFSVNKKIGKAHTRNKLKRRLREITKRLPIKKFKNYVLMAKEGSEQLDFNTLQNEVKRLFEKYEKRV